ncbi:MAG: hypothetical protein IJS69_01715 [Selenomonadaceae bacterium]|nr:hypothetical protein [Selenomonadaceae bacterium]
MKTDLIFSTIFLISFFIGVIFYNNAVESWNSFFFGMAFIVAVSNIGKEVMRRSERRQSRRVR